MHENAFFCKSKRRILFRNLTFLLQLFVLYYKGKFKKPYKNKRMCESYEKDENRLYDRAGNR